MNSLPIRNDVPSKKKVFYDIQPDLRHYLAAYDRETELPVQYSDLLHFNFSTPLLDKDNKDTLWQSVQYDQDDMNTIYPGLCHIYALLHADGNKEVIEHLSVARIDYCTFGNSKPFRIRIINRLNDNYDHFYIKIADASRVYGLELEHILSPNRITYISDKKTLVEEHIPGLPGDVFLDRYLDDTKFNQIRICKEFIKFNERCFVRLLGDMRSYNFVVDITPEVEGNQYRIRAIDFDQQSYEGSRKLYLPHYFKENNKLISLGIQHMNVATMKQYQQEERSLIANRVKLGRNRLEDLFDAMKTDDIAPANKLEQLKTELADHHGNREFLTFSSMGQIVEKHLYSCLKQNLN